MQIRCLCVLAITVSLGGKLHGQDSTISSSSPRYRLVDLGTFGGPNSYYFLPHGTEVSRAGLVAGAADTNAPDTDNPCFGNACLAVHAFEWKHGLLRDLGVLPGGTNSAAIYLNDSGLIAGFADNGQIDPITGTPDLVAVAWNRGNMMEIGTFGGSFSFPNAINQRLLESLSMPPLTTIPCWASERERTRFFGETGTCATWERWAEQTPGQPTSTTEARWRDGRTRQPR